MRVDSTICCATFLGQELYCECSPPTSLLRRRVSTGCAPPPLQAVWLYACTAVRTQNHTHTRVRPHHSGAAPCHEELHHNRPASGNGHSCSVRGLTAVSTADLLAPYMSTVHHFSVCPRLYFTCTAWKTHGSTACKNCVPQSAPPSQRATQREL